MHNFEYVYCNSNFTVIFLLEKMPVKHQSTTTNRKKFLPVDALNGQWSKSALDAVKDPLNVGTFVN